MTSGRKFTVALNLALFTMVLVTVTAYVAGYFVLGEYSANLNKQFVLREYPHTWQVKAYRPAGVVESWLRQVEVVIDGPERYARRTPVDTPLQPLSDEELDAMIQQWAKSEGFDLPRDEAPD